MLGTFIVHEAHDHKPWGSLKLVQHRLTTDVNKPHILCYDIIQKPNKVSIFRKSCCTGFTRKKKHFLSMKTYRTIFQSKRRWYIRHFDCISVQFSANKSVGPFHIGNLSISHQAISETCTRPETAPVRNICLVCQH